MTIHKWKTGWASKELADEIEGQQYERFKAQEQANERVESLKALEADLKEVGKKKKYNREHWKTTPAAPNQS